MVLYQELFISSLKLFITAKLFSTKCVVQDGCEGNFRRK